MSEYSESKIYKIEDGVNTNYLSCLLLSLFFNKTIIYSIFLENDSIKPQYVYIQELIKNIINNIKNYNFINATSLNNLKTILHINNFKNMESIMETNYIEDLYNYLYDIFNVNKIQILDIDKNAIISELTYLKLQCDDYNTNIKNLIKTNYSSKILNNIPNFIAIKIEKKNKNMIVDIQKKITINNIFNIKDIIDNTYSGKKNLIWYIYSIICYDDKTEKYFSYIYNNNNWFKISDNNENCIIKIDIRLEEYIIKKKSIFLIYILEK